MAKNSGFDVKFLLGEKESVNCDEKSAGVCGYLGSSVGDAGFTVSSVGEQ